MTEDKPSPPGLTDPPPVRPSSDVKFAPGGIVAIEGIGAVYGGKLRAVGVDTYGQLLQKAGRRTSRAELAAATGIGEGKILAWVNHADLLRIRGVGPAFSDLLEAAGVDSRAELARRKGTKLAATVKVVVVARPDIVRRVPSEKEIANWIRQAKALPKVVEE